MSSVLSGVIEFFRSVFRCECFFKPKHKSQSETQQALPTLNAKNISFKPEPVRKPNTNVVYSPLLIKNYIPSVECAHREETLALVRHIEAGQRGDALINEKLANYYNEDISEFEQQFHDELAWVHHIPVPEPPNKYPYFVTSPVEDLHRKLFTDLFQLFFNEMFFVASKEGREESPFLFRGPQELRQLIDFNLPQHAASSDEILNLVKTTIYHQPRLGHAFFMRQGFAGLEPYSCIADLPASCINSYPSSFVLSTVTTMLEAEIIRELCSLVGYDTQGDGDGDGVILPGSTLALGYAMKMAYISNNKEDSKHTLNRPYFFVNERADYAYIKFAIFLGFGAESVVPIKANPNGSMDLKELESKIDYFTNSGSACMVVGTAGTPVVRAIDELDKLANICEQHNIWFHVDATYGGGLLCSEIHKHKLKGVERSDSISWSHQYTFGVPCTSSYFLVSAQHKQRMKYQYWGIGEGTEHVFKSTPLLEARYEVKNKRLHYSMRPDMLKVWLMWKAKGTHGLGRHVEHIMKNAEFCLEEMKKRESFIPLLDNFEGTNVCFWFVPKNYRGIFQASKEYKEKVSRLSVAIKRVLMERGICVVSYNEFPASNEPTFLVIGLHNSAVSSRDIVYILDKIEEVGNILSNPKHPKYYRYMLRKM